MMCELILCNGLLHALIDVKTYRIYQGRPC